MATWYPGAMSYWQWSQANSFMNDFKGQSNQIKDKIHEQTNSFSDNAKSIVATNEQISTALENGFNRLYEINEKGFDHLTSAIEELHSDLNYNLGILIQRAEYQNHLLNNILHTLQTPFESQVKELYNNGCRFIRQENLDAAIDCFNESLTLKMGKYFFPSYYQLGRLYLTGKVENQNIINPKTAMEYLLKANELGNGIFKEEPLFSPILSDCKFFLSQSYYFQLTGVNDSNENDLLSNAIKYCEEAVSLNSNLSQGFYHLAKYYSYQNNVESLLNNLSKAINIYRDYSFKYEEDEVFNKNKKHIEALLIRIRDGKKKSVEKELQQAKISIDNLVSRGIENFPNLKSEYIQIKEKFRLAEEDFQTGTYFGFDDCGLKLNEL
jgi:tetratricopeptide (TPR) repeat protein